MRVALTPLVCGLFAVCISACASKTVTAYPPAPEPVEMYPVPIDAGAASPDRPAIYAPPVGRSPVAAHGASNTTGLTSLRLDGGRGMPAGPDPGAHGAAVSKPPVPVPYPDPDVRTQGPAPSPLAVDARIPAVAPPASASVPPLPAAAVDSSFGSPQQVASVPQPTGPDGYIVGVGDTVTVNVFGQPDLTITTNVSDDGTVPMALIGKTAIAGLTPSQAADRIAGKLRAGQYLVSPQVSVALNQYISRQISVLGEVKLPGRFPVSARLTVLDALALAGGVTDLGSPRVYVLRPANGVVTRYEVDVEALLGSARGGQQYFDLHGGDTVMVPRAEVFYIYGEVKTPNSYRLRAGATVVQALSLGGGLTDKGSDSRIDIRRRDADGQLVTRRASLNDPLRPDDIVYVHERIF